MQKMMEFLILLSLFFTSTFACTDGDKDCEENFPFLHQQDSTTAKCGLTSVSKSRVIGGKTATPGAWPWHAGLYVKGKYVCGGALVNPFWIVTAAHCLENVTAQDFQVVLGDSDRRKNEREQILNVSLVLMHPDFHKPTYVSNDIGLLKLQQPAKMNTRVQPVCLPRKEEKPSVGSKCVMTGWGKTQIPGPYSQTLQQLRLTILSRVQCAKKNGEYFPISKRVFCAANVNSSSNESGCHGDSGSPFVCQEKDGHWKINGIVSWGSGTCDIKDAYSVLVRVSAFTDWLDNYIVV